MTAYVRALATALIFLSAAGAAWAQENEPGALACCLSLSSSCDTGAAEDCALPDAVALPAEVCCSLPLAREACVEGENPSCDTGQPGACADGAPACNEAGALVCEPRNEPATETCNGEDDDCNGVIDDGFAIGEVCGSSVGTCQPGTWQCTPEGGRACVGAVGPAAETCNGLDDDCNGAVDDGGASNECTTGDPCFQGVCSNGSCVAVPAPNGAACDDGNACTVFDACFSGTCTGQPQSCDDGVSCTHDTCNPATGQCAIVPDDGQCPAGATCQPGIGCECPVGMADCNGTCVDLQSDASHCGACNTFCPGVCSAGFCS